jgi:hypothetical protein
VTNILRALVGIIATPRRSLLGTLDPANTGSSITLSNGNLRATSAAGSSASSVSQTSHATGKWYYEGKFLAIGNPGGNGLAAGLVSSSWIPTGPPGFAIGYNTNADGFAVSGAGRNNNSTFMNWSATVAVNDVIAIAADIDDSLFWVKNLTQGTDWNLTVGASPGGTGGATGFPAGGTPYYAAVGFESGNSGEIEMNFGNNSFVGSVPAGYTAWG